MHVLHHDDGGVDHGSDRYGDAAQRHDVRGEPHVLHRDERKQDRDGQQQGGDQRGAEVQQEEQDHEGDDDQLLDQRVLERLDAGADERRAVIRRDDLDSLGERLLELLDARFYRVDDLKSVRA